MKKYLFFAFLLTFSGALFFSGCQKDEFFEPEQSEADLLSMYKDEPVYCGETFDYPLVNFVNTLVAGTVTIGNSEDYLYVTYQAEPGWNFFTNYVYVGLFEGIPLTEYNYFNYAGFTQYYYNNNVGLTANTLEIPKSEITMDEDGNFVIAVNANSEDVANTTTPRTFVQVFGNGSYSESPFGYYIDYTWQECPAEMLGGPQLAFAYNAQYSECFKDLKRSNGKLNTSGNGTWKNFMLWGWRNGEFNAGTYYFDLYAGSGDCDPEAGTVVGTVVLEYDGSSATLSYEVDEAYTLISTYAYVGKKRLYKKWGKYHVFPLVYPQKHFQINSTSDSFTFDNLNGDHIYMTVGALVKDAAP